MTAPTNNKTTLISKVRHLLHELARVAWRSRVPMTRRPVIAVTVATTLLVGSGVGTAVAIAKSRPSPTKIQNVCHSEVETKDAWPVDQYRVIAWCDSLDSNTRARGVLDTKWDVDAHTAWFTNTGVKHYSDWKTSLAVRGSRVEYSAR